MAEHLFLDDVQGAREYGEMYVHHDLMNSDCENASLVVVAAAVVAVHNVAAGHAADGEILGLVTQIGGMDFAPLHSRYIERVQVRKILDVIDWEGIGVLDSTFPNNLLSHRPLLVGNVDFVPSIDFQDSSPRLDNVSAVACQHVVPRHLDNASGAVHQPALSRHLDNAPVAGCQPAEPGRFDNVLAVVLHYAVSPCLDNSSGDAFEHEMPAHLDSPYGVVFQPAVSPRLDNAFGVAFQHAVVTQRLDNSSDIAVLQHAEQLCLDNASGVVLQAAV